MESPRIALMQPAFLPWQGFFGLVAGADVFGVAPRTPARAATPVRRQDDAPPAGPANEPTDANAA